MNTETQKALHIVTRNFDVLSQIKRIQFKCEFHKRLRIYLDTKLYSIKCLKFNNLGLFS